MRKTFLIALLAITAFISTGCIKGILRFNPDGSGQLEIGFNMSLTALEEAQMMSGEGSSDMGEFEELLNGDPIVDEETGISVTAEERLENGSMWTYIIFNMPTADSWAQLSKISGDVLPETDGDDSPADLGLFTEVPNITIDGSTIRVELTVPSAIDPDAEQEEDPFGMSAIMGSFIQMSYEIEMPGTLGEHNGQIDTLTGNPVWILDMASPDDMEIVVEATLD